MVERSIDAHFKEICKSKAVIQLPASPVHAIGIVFLDDDAARQSFLSSADHYTDFVDPGRGRYQMIETKMPNLQEFSASIWDPKASSPGDSRRIDGVRLMAPTQSFAFRTTSIATEEEIRLGIDGIETIVKNLATNEIVARRVIYARYVDKDNKAETYYKGAMFSAVCPTGALNETSCTINGCSVLPFIISAVQPEIPKDIHKAFHLYKGVGQYKGIDCGSQINIGPGISPGDIDWWAFGTTGINLRVRGTDDHVYCWRFGLGSTPPTLYFTDGSSEILSLEKFRENERGTSDFPRKLIDTVIRK